MTSSANYPQSNSAAERMVQTLKNLLTKSDDPYIRSAIGLPLHSLRERI